MSAPARDEFLGVFALSSDALEALLSAHLLTELRLFAGSTDWFFHFNNIATMKSTSIEARSTIPTPSAIFTNSFISDEDSSCYFGGISVLLSSDTSSSITSD